jgi:hypothetical protein
MYGFCVDVYIVYVKMNCISRMVSGGQNGSDLGDIQISSY